MIDVAPFDLLLAESDPARPWTWAFVGLTFVMYLVIGWLSRVRDSKFMSQGRAFRQLPTEPQRLLTG